MFNSIDDVVKSIEGDEKNKQELETKIKNLSPIDPIKLIFWINNNSELCDHSDGICRECSDEQCGNETSCSNLIIVPNKLKDAIMGNIFKKEVEK